MVVVLGGEVGMSSQRPGPAKVLDFRRGLVEDGVAVGRAAAAVADEQHALGGDRAVVGVGHVGEVRRWRVPGRAAPQAGEALGVQLGLDDALLRRGEQLAALGLDVVPISCAST
jgi:hypothetical protein